MPRDALIRRASSSLRTAPSLNLVVWSAPRTIAALLNLSIVPSISFWPFRMRQLGVDVSKRRSELVLVSIGIMGTLRAAEPEALVAAPGEPFQIR